MSYKILAIDDHAETLDIVVMTLKRFGYQVVSSISPVEGLVLAETERPDLILLDMHMPEMDGKEVCRRLRAHASLASIPVIMFTAIGDVDKKREGFDAGADDYLVKPTDPDEMISRIEALLEGVTKPVPGEPMVEPETIITTVDRPDKAGPVSTLPDSAPAVKQLIAIMGARGGVGVTTLATNLALCMAEAGCPTTLVDLDMVQGHAGLYLGQKRKAGLDALVELPEAQIPAALPQHLRQIGDNLQLLGTWPDLDGRHPQLSPKQTAALIEGLMQPGQCVIVDMGRGVSEMTRPVLEQATDVLVCLKPERVAMTAARQLLRQLRQELPRNPSLGAIMIPATSGISLPAKTVEAFLGHPLLAVIPSQAAEMVQAINKGIPVCRLDPDSPAADQFRQLAAQFVKAHSEAARA
ncbi:MAG: response regulator [Anaerolineae bacterium]